MRTVVCRIGHIYAVADDDRARVLASGVSRRMAPLHLELSAWHIDRFREPFVYMNAVGASRVPDSGCVVIAHRTIEDMDRVLKVHGRGIEDAAMLENVPRRGEDGILPRTRGRARGS